MAVQCSTDKGAGKDICLWVYKWLLYCSAVQLGGQVRTYLCLWACVRKYN